MRKIERVLVDQVAGGWNIDFVRKEKINNAIVYKADRIARFGAELCANEEDKILAKELAEEFAVLLRNKYGLIG